MEAEYSSEILDIKVKYYTMSKPKNYNMDFHDSENLKTYMEYLPVHLDYIGTPRTLLPALVSIMKPTESDDYCIQQTTCWS
jgi:hypothetical protein